MKMTQTWKKESVYFWTNESDLSLFLQYSEYNSSIRCSCLKREVENNLIVINAPV